MNNNLDYKIKKYQHKYSRLMNQRAGADTYYQYAILCVLDDGKSNTLTNLETAMDIAGEKGTVKMQVNLGKFTDLTKDIIKGTIYKYITDDRDEAHKILGLLQKGETSNKIQCPGKCKVTWASKKVVNICLDKIPKIKTKAIPIIPSIGFTKIKETTDSWREYVAKIISGKTGGEGGVVEQKINKLFSLDWVNPFLKATGLTKVGETIGNFVHTGVSEGLRLMGDAGEGLRGLATIVSSGINKLPVVGPIVSDGTEKITGALSEAWNQGTKTVTGLTEQLSTEAKDMKKKISENTKILEFTDGLKSIKTPEQAKGFVDTWSSEIQKIPAIKDFVNKSRKTVTDIMESPQAQTVLSSLQKVFTPTTGGLSIHTGGKIRKHKKGSKKKHSKKTKHHKKKHNDE
jgi:hypothetical protein